MSRRPKDQGKETEAMRALRMGVRSVRFEPGALPGDPPIVVLHLYGGAALLFKDAEGNPGGALHVLGADGKTCIGIVEGEGAPVGDGCLR